MNKLILPLLALALNSDLPPQTPLQQILTQVEQQRYVNTHPSPALIPTGVNLYIQQLPSSISGAQQIQTYATPGAQYCLIHLRQRHYKESLKDNPQAMHDILTIQQEIYDILTSLPPDQKKVYEEGLTQEDFNYFMNSLEVIQQKYITLKAMRTPQNQNSTTTIQQQIKQLQTIEMTTLGAAAVLAREKKVILYPAEAEPADLTPPSSTTPKMEQREHFVLEQIVKNQTPLAFVVYGASHDFGDTIELWNQSHPNAKFSFIEITPANYNYLKTYNTFHQ